MTALTSEKTPQSISGKMAELIRTHAWSATPLGPMESWPQSLRTIVDLILPHHLPMAVLWTRELIQIYNDAYRHIIADAHPAALGRPGPAFWPAGRQIDAAAWQVLWDGEPLKFDNARFDKPAGCDADGRRFDLSYSPIRDDTGAVAGVLVIAVEGATARAETELREREAVLAADLADITLLRDLAERLVSEDNVATIYEEILSAAISIMKSDGGTVQVYEPETQSLVLLVTRNFDRTMVDHFHRVDAQSRTGCGAALRNGRRTFVDFGDDDTDESCVMHVGAGYRSAQATPLLSRSGKPLGMLNTHWHAAGHRPSERQLRFLDLLARQAADLIQQRDSEKTVRESEERLRQFGEASQDVLWIRDAATLQWTYLTPAFETIYGLRREEGLSGDNFRSWLELIVPADRAQAEAAMARVRLGEHVTFEYRVQRPRDGAIRWLRNSDFPITDSAGRVAMIGGIGEDVTESKLANERLEQSEERLRSAIEVGRLGLWDWNILTDELHWSDEHFRMEGYAVGEVTPSYDTWAARLHPADRPAAEAALAHAMEIREEYRHEFRVVHPDGSIHWLSGQGRFFYDEAGRAVRMVGAMSDVTVRREWEERQTVLVAELQHRTRNLMGVIRSVAERTARTSADLPDFRARFGLRLDALARTQGLLSRLNDIERVTFDELLATELSAMDGQSGRVELAGPAGIRLRSSTVQTLAMALHELATNAVKYGAIGQPQGRVAVRWSLEPQGAGDKPWLHINWQESGVTMPVGSAPPKGSGQGRELIERALPYQLGAKTSFTLGPDGVHCSISVPVSDATSSVGSAASV